MFDLENAIREWKKSLFKDPGIEESHVIELEEGLREEIEELCQEGLSEEEAFRRVAAEMAPADVLGTEFYKVRTTRRSGRPSWRAPRLMPELLWSYFKVALRKINRQKSYSFINIAGLSAAMACSLLILTFIQFELSFDRFFKNSDRIFRVALREDSPEEESYSLSTPEILSKAIKTSIPEIEKVGIIQRSSNALIQAGDKRFTEDGLCADAGFFELFSFDLVLGDRASVLEAPNSIVLSDRLAEKLFGDANPVGQNILYKGRFFSHDLVVTGIVKHPPKNSHLQFDYLISIASMAADEELKDWFNAWNTYAFHTYVQLQQKQARHQVERKIQSLIKEARPEISLKEDAVFLQPVTDIHLKSRVSGSDRDQRPDPNRLSLRLDSADHSPGRGHQLHESLNGLGNDPEQGSLHAQSDRSAADRPDQAVHGRVLFIDHSGHGPLRSDVLCVFPCLFRLCGNQPDGQ